jgi:hypothetical protein
MRQALPAVLWPLALSAQAWRQRAARQHERNLHIRFLRQRSADEQFHGVADDFLDEIEKRFDLLDPAQVRRTKQGWPSAFG